MSCTFQGTTSANWAQVHKLESQSSLLMGLLVMLSPRADTAQHTAAQCGQTCSTTCCQPVTSGRSRGTVAAHTPLSNKRHYLNSRIGGAIHKEHDALSQCDDNLVLGHKLHQHAPQALQLCQWDKHTICCNMHNRG